MMTTRQIAPNEVQQRHPLGRLPAIAHIVGRWDSATLHSVRGISAWNGFRLRRSWYPASPLPLGPSRVVVVGYMRPVRPAWDVQIVLHIRSSALAAIIAGLHLSGFVRFCNYLGD